MHASRLNATLACLCENLVFDVMSDNSTNNKRIAKNTLLLYFRMFFIMIVSFYTSRIVLQTLGVDDFGIYNVVGGIIIMLGFINTSMSNTIQRFLSFAIEQNNLNKLNSVFSVSMQMQIYVSLIIILLGETIGLWFFYHQINIPSNRVNAAFWVYQLSIVQTVVLILSVPYNALIIAYERMSAFAYISIFEVIAKLLIVYLLLMLNFDKLILYAILMFIIQLFIRLIYTFYCNNYFKHIKFKWTRNQNLQKEIFCFAGWNTLGTCSEIVQSQGLNIILNLFFGPAVNAARGVAMQLQGVVRNFSINFLLAINPQIIKSYASNNIDYMKQLIFSSSRLAFILFYIVSLPVFILADKLLALWLVQVPEYSVVFVRIILCVTIVSIIFDPLKIAINATGKVKYVQLLTSILLLSTLMVSYIVLENNAKAYYVFYVQLIISFLILLVYIYYLQIIVGISSYSFVKEVLFRLFLIVLLTFPLPVIMNEILPDSFSKYIVILLTSLSVTMTVSFILGLSETEKLYVKNKIRMIIGK